MDNLAYQTMQGLTRHMDRYHLDALIGVIPGWGDAIALASVLVVLLLLIALMIWALVSFDSYLYSLVASIF